LAKARLDRLRSGTDPEPLLALLAQIRRELGSRPPLQIADLAIGGKDLIGLGVRPGPIFGTILARTMDRVLEDPSLNEKETLLALVEEDFRGST
jgi:tRNA nucleotidyltransferase (CCA-adding enzyme)